MNYTQVQQTLSKLNGPLNTLKALGIRVTPLGDLSFNWDNSYISERVDYLSTLEDHVALALAVTQEEWNGPVSDSDIEFVNKFFQINVTRNLVQEKSKLI